MLKVLKGIFQNTYNLQKKKTKESDYKSVSSVFMLLVLRSFSEGGVPGAGLFYEPFLRDLELLCSIGYRQSVE